MPNNYSRDLNECLMMSKRHFIWQYMQLNLSLSSKMMSNFRCSSLCGARCTYGEEKGGGDDIFSAKQFVINIPRTYIKTFLVCAHIYTTVNIIPIVYVCIITVVLAVPCTDKPSKKF